MRCTDTAATQVWFLEQAPGMLPPSGTPLLPPLPPHPPYGRPSLPYTLMQELLRTLFFSHFLWVVCPLLPVLFVCLFSLLGF